MYKDFTGVEAYTKCLKCGKTIAVTRQFDIGIEYIYETENLNCRYIDKWGFERNYCKSCMR